LNESSLQQATVDGCRNACELTSLALPVRANLGLHYHHNSNSRNASDGAARQYRGSRMPSVPAMMQAEGLDSSQ
jgi:hypothetical protein